MTNLVGLAKILLAFFLGVAFMTAVVLTPSHDESAACTNTSTNTVVK